MNQSNSAVYSSLLIVPSSWLNLEPNAAIGNYKMHSDGKNDIMTAVEISCRSMVRMGIWCIEFDLARNRLPKAFCVSTKSRDSIVYPHLGLEF